MSKPMHSNLRLNVTSTLVLTVVTAFMWIILTTALMAAFGFRNPGESDQSEGLYSLLALFGLCISNSIMVVWYTNRTVLTGTKLFTNIFILIFCIMSAMTQIETIFFNSSIKMPLQIIALTVFVGAVVGTISGMYAIRIKMKLKQESSNIDLQVVSLKEGLGKIALLSVIYLIFYFLFGYYIAWQFPEIREFYSGSYDIFPFITHMKNQISNQPLLIVLQVFRGFLWAMIGYVLLKGLSIKNSIERYMLMGLLLSIPLATPLFAPNAFMPSGVRFGHFFELLIENFLFGVILTYSLAKKNTKRVAE